MFLKVSKKPITIRCELKKGREWQMIRIGTSYSFYLAESSRSDNGILQRSLAGLGNYSLKEYEPICVGQGITALGSTCKKVYVSSFGLDDSTSFRKVDPDPPVRFYHTFCRRLMEAAASYNTTVEKLREICGQVTAIIPLYDYDGYRTYVLEEIKNKFRKELTDPHGNFDELLNQDTYCNLYDYVTLQDDLLVAMKNILKVKVNYDFHPV